MRSDLGIHYVTVTKCKKTKFLYLDYFIITNQLTMDAKKVDLSLRRLTNFISDKRNMFFKSSILNISNKAISNK